jgi:HEAT repeat protein
MIARCPAWNGAVCLLAAWLLSPIVTTAVAAPLSDAAPALAHFASQVEDRSRSAAERLDLIKMFGEWATPQVRAPLLAVLDDPLPEIREAAARALGWQGNRDAVGALRRRLDAADETVAVRAAVIEALGLIGDDSARAVVLASVQDPDARVRGAALRGLTLGSLQSPADRIPLLRLLVQDRALELILRCQAANALGEAKDVGSVGILTHLLEHEPRIAMPLPPEPVPQQEIAMMRYREARDVRAWAARALGMIGERSALPLLIKSAEDPEDFFVRYVSISVLFYWNAPEALPVFVRGLEDPFKDVRIAALAALAKSGARSSIDRILACLSDTDPRVRIQAIFALAELGDARVRSQLEALQDQEENMGVQDALAKALTQLPH